MANTSTWTLPVRFNSAGRAALCYSDDGSFSTGHVDLISVMVTAEGIFSSCEVGGCELLSAVLFYLFFFF